MAPNIRTGKRLLDELCAAAAPHDNLIMQGVAGERQHALDVLSWVLRLDRGASLALRLAALFHDVDRLVNPTKAGGFKGSRGGVQYLRHKKRHAKRSALFIRPLLRKRRFPESTVKRTVFLITHHDDNGDEVEGLADAELNMLVAADTFAFFSSIAPTLLTAEGEDRLRQKTKFMIEKLPESARQMLWEHELDSQIFDRLKNDIIRDYYLENSVRERWFRFCPFCRKKLRRRLIDGEGRLACNGCGFVYWNPPHPVTSVAIWDGERVLLLRRARTPLLGFWCLPGGYVRYSEKPIDAAVREVKEETDLDVEIDNLIGVYQIDNDPRGVNIDIIWGGRVLGGEVSLNEEGSESRWFKIDELPARIAYKHRTAIHDSRKTRLNSPRV